MVAPRAAVVAWSSDPSDLIGLEALGDTHACRGARGGFPGEWCNGFLGIAIVEVRVLFCDEEVMARLQVCYV